MAIARPQSNVCECRGDLKNLPLKACYLRPSTVVTYVTHDDHNVRVTTVMSNHSRSENATSQHKPTESEG